MRVRVGVGCGGVGVWGCGGGGVECGGVRVWGCGGDSGIPLLWGPWKAKHASELSTEANQSFSTASRSYVSDLEPYIVYGNMNWLYNCS